MAKPPSVTQSLWDLFREARARSLSLGPDDYLAVRAALQAGFGWTEDGLRDLCVALWAKSRREAEVLRTVFDSGRFDWSALAPEPAMAADGALPLPAAASDTPAAPSASAPPADELLSPPVTEAFKSLPSIPIDRLMLPDRRFLFVPQFPVSEREVAQVWRRLRRPVRRGPAIELDVRATIDRRSRAGVATPLVLVPARRNVSRVLLLVDRQGSMAPFHDFVDHVRRAIEESARLAEVSTWYFHDVPARAGDTSLLARTGGAARRIDDVLADIEPAETGELYTDAGLSQPRALSDVLHAFGSDGAAVLISDAGAARASYDPVRVLDTLSFLKTLRREVPRYAWLNPLPEETWARTTAAQLARHVTMFPITRSGLQAAVDVLRGQPASVERPL